IPGHTLATVLVALGEYEKVIELLERGYNYDLNGLGRRLQNRTSMNKRQEIWKPRLMAALEARGVTFPIPPRQGP
ncbi:MAG: hypothetical protein ACK4OJ_15035, partial [Brevundimonas sp.]